MARMTVEESRSLMPTKEAGIRPVASIKPSSNMSVKGTNHMLSPPYLFSFYNDISSSMRINNTIYHYYSQMLVESVVSSEICLFCSGRSHTFAPFELLYYSTILVLVCGPKWLL